MTPADSRKSADPFEGLPQPAPEVIMAANGVYWRRYSDALSMVPVSDDNDPVLTPVVIYKPLGYEDHEGRRHFLPDVIERVAQALADAPADTDRRRLALSVMRRILGDGRA